MVNTVVSFVMLLQNAFLACMNRDCGLSNVCRVFSPAIFFSLSVDHEEGVPLQESRHQETLLFAEIFQIM